MGICVFYLTGHFEKFAIPLTFGAFYGSIIKVYKSQTSQNALKLPWSALFQEQRHMRLPGMSKRKKSPSQLKFKYKARRTFLLLLLFALVGGGGWLLGQKGVGTAKTADASAASQTEPPQASVSSEGEPEPSSKEEAPPQSEASPQEEDSTDSTSVEPSAQPSGGSWSLLLVNPDNPLPDGFQVELESIYDGSRVDSRIAGDARRMFTAAKLRGISLYPKGGYRGGDDPPAACGHLSGDAGETGYRTDEHGTGLALDIASADYETLDEGFGETDAYRWLAQNACQYGFILRYPAGKESVTQSAFKPWHFRYVGPAAALTMQENGMCLEEYLDYVTGESSGGEPDGDGEPPEAAGE